ncbi:MAG: endonuclease domain-containing protein [Hyphomicrobiaceae bacterium]|nr:endonuclease domain-containing protein [Hyphomicrobiaceae bacterium]
MNSQQFIARSIDEVATGIRQAVAGKVSVFIGVPSDRLKSHFANAELADHERLPLMIRSDLRTFVDFGDNVLNLLAGTALDIWPFWYVGEDFSNCENAASGRASAAIKIHSLKTQSPFCNLSREWAERAINLVLDGQLPRFSSFPRQIELQQLCLAIHTGGLTLIVDIPELPCENQAAGLVRSLEWLAENGPLAVIALLPKGAEKNVSLQRILYGAQMCVASSDESIPRSHTVPSGLGSVERGDIGAEFLGMVRGRPHPNSPAEQKLARALKKDPDLSQLFALNQPVETVRGSRFTVDMVWGEGRVLVEVDGSQHFRDVDIYEADRQRDYELHLSGYLMLRLTSREVLSDTDQSIDKIRDFVKLRRANWQ